MPILSRTVLAAALLTGLGGQGATAATNAFRDPLDAPARVSRNAARSMFSDVAAVADGRYVAVGRRGLILVSKDGAATWEQAKAPVSTDLLSVSFPDGKNGWAVGHGGVVLHSSDGGVNWVRQLDARTLPDLMIQRYKPAADGGDEVAKRNLDEAERFKADGPGRPLMAVHFTDALRGIAVGAYNLAVRTDDGGRSWRPVSEQLENPQGMHLYGIAHVDGRLWIAGEQGLLLREETPGGRFVQVKTPYPGSFFGIAGRTGELIVFGLRGNALRSTDGGATWKSLQTGTQSNLTAGKILPDGRLVLAAMSGELLVSSDGGTSFTRLPQAHRAPQFALAATKSGVVTAGALGVGMQVIPPSGAAGARHENSSTR
jgi:photosystem II stability/assembly factor-like uncharacterized protein